ncbi:Non-specific serine/threonine protein kinase [Mycena sanguinolenta]|uniref:Non-specific serine/threonine protein kinase n=1 Tax=Mycena sanguinolenta TaxID=230812 RepID=A0A8H7CV87_9AGAR|nr:Non-specific serine/threonine protein kinase [Mycena sanguinolenta]
MFRQRPVSMPSQPDANTSQTRSASSKKRSNRILGDYTLSKTLGAGSMGKVKLATHNITGEKLAVKILPRTTSTAPRDTINETRTLREAALSMLLHHPYICGMREMIVHEHHYYMVFEYVNGGQMLDYIISHGRLRERVARKFARQIASALDYCHRNNVVHRDLKLENILISQTGNIKIIDFGLSNLYNPVAHLDTFCGNMYFPAPELLNATAYTGPEVDVWSFGVVLYILVCGRCRSTTRACRPCTPKSSEDWSSIRMQTHPLPHARRESRPPRAPLRDPRPPMDAARLLRPTHRDAPPRPPRALRPADIDPNVIQGMSGFEFGADADAAEIQDRLLAVLESDAYSRAVRAWERRHHTHAQHPAASSPISSPSSTGGATATPRDKKRRFSGFDFYCKKLFASPSSLPTPLPSQRALSLGGLQPQDRDPTQGFHPLVSMYYLVSVADAAASSSTPAPDGAGDAKQQNDAASASTFSTKEK